MYNSFVYPAAVFFERMQHIPFVDLFEIFAEDKLMIAYRPKWRKITGNVTATILLQQIIFHWNKSGRKPFYKFKEPCEHELYRKGDSWTEELGFSRTEFDTAIRKIGYKKSQKRNSIHTLPVEYWVEPSRLTFYTIHADNLSKLLLQLYQKEIPDLPCQHGECPVTQETRVTKSRNPDLQVTQETRVTKSGNPTIDLTQETRVTKSSNPDFPILDQRSSSEKENSSESESDTPALTLFQQHFPKVLLNAEQKRLILQTVKHLPAWEYTLAWWKVQNYQADKVGNLIDFYETKALPKLAALAEIKTTQMQPANSKIAQTAIVQKKASTIGSEWEQVQQYLSERINPPSFNTWIRPVRGESFGNNGQPVKLYVPDTVFEYWIGEYYCNVIQDAYETIRGTRPELTFVVQESNETTEQPQLL